MTDTAVQEAPESTTAEVVDADAQGLPVAPFQLVAIDGKQLATAHTHMISWAKMMQHRTGLELAEEQQALAHATENKWAVSGIRNRLKQAEKRIDFYRKIELALEAGYVVVPNFAMEVFAIRTNATNARPANSDRHWERFRQNAQMLPTGDGEYKSNLPQVYQRTIEVSDGKGGMKDAPEYFPVELRDVSFPIALAKPILMERTAKAMAAKLFDEIGASVDAGVTAQSAGKTDPIIIGRILNPRKGRPSMSFFIGWFQDLSRL